jgi:2,5-diketo-D-gluconate reductase A
MEKNGMQRRAFLRTGAGFAAAALLLPFGTDKVFGAMAAKSAIPTVALNNGLQMPRIGFGTNTLGGDVCIRSVADAISVGYRLIDTAHIYGNEEAVGAGIKQSGIDRKELFVTSKLWVDFAGYESTKKAFQTTIDKLGTDYLDLYLIHRPRGDYKGSWKAMEELYKAGKIKAIGVSNFDHAQLKD